MVLTSLLEEHGLGSEWWITAAHMTGAKSEGGNKYEPWSSNMGDLCDCKVCVCVFLQGMEMSRIFHSCPFAWLCLR